MPAYRRKAGRPGEAAQDLGGLSSAHAAPLSVGALASVPSALAPPRQASIRRDDSTHLSPGDRTPGRLIWRLSCGCCLKLSSTLKPLTKSSAAARQSEALDRIQEALQPEALYGFVEDGQRAFFAVFDLADPSEIPVISEPLFQRANVKITLTPCMTLEDVKKGIEEAARRMAAMQG